MAAYPKKGAKSGTGELWAAAGFALLALAVVLYVRLRLLGMPLERDEGEYAYAGQLILQGLSPYLHAYTMKLPGTAYLNALFFFCFGQTVTAIRLGLLLANLLTAVLLFAVGRRLYGAAAGLLAAGVYGLLTLSQHLLATFAHATHFVALFVVAALLCLSGDRKPLPQTRYLLAGLLFGCAFLVKQHAVFFFLGGCVTVLATTRPLRVAVGNSVTMLFGFLLPYGALLLLVLKQGAFGSFWFWTVRYASRYATGLTPAMGWFNFKAQLGEIVAATPGYWVLALIGLFLLLAIRRDRREAALLLPLLLAALAAITPGYYFRPHYFILLAPVVALLAAGAAGGSIVPRPLKAVLLVGFFVAAGFQLRNEGWFLFAATPQQYLKRVYQTTKPFVETAVVADYVAKQTKPGQRIQVLGSEPQVYFYAHRLAATGNIYIYPLMEDQPFAAQMQQQMLQELAAARPAYLVLVDDPSSWLGVSASGEAFREKLAELAVRDYELDGVARVSRSDESFYVFGERARQFLPDSGSRILVYRLKTS